jgi:BA14K-like protein
MLTKTKIALAAAFILGSASAVLANDNDRNDSGGFRVPGSMVGVNPAFHRSLRHAGEAYDYVIPFAGGSDSAYCQQRFRSYDVASGTYLGFDGLRHPCP